MARAFGWKVALATLVLGQLLATTAAVFGQEFVVRDRLNEARERVSRERMAAQATPVMDSVADESALPVTPQPGLSKSEPEAPGENAESAINSHPRESASASGSQEFVVLTGHPQPFQAEPTSLQLNPAGDSYTATEPVGSPVVEVPASGLPGESLSVWQEPTNNEVWGVPADDAGWMQGADFAAGSRSAWGELEPGPYDYSWRREIPGVVLTNTHWHDGPRGEGYAAPFGYSSAYCRSGTGPQQDARGNPSFCDEWKSACGCSCCEEPFGLDIFKSRPYGPWPQKKHGCGCQTECNGCAEGAGACGGTAGDGPAHAGRQGLFDEPLFSIR